MWNRSWRPSDARCTLNYWRTSLCDLRSSFLFRADLIISIAVYVAFMGLAHFLLFDQASIRVPPVPRSWIQRRSIYMSVLKITCSEERLLDVTLLSSSFVVSKSGCNNLKINSKLFLSVSPHTVGPFLCSSATATCICFPSATVAVIKLYHSLIEKLVICGSNRKIGTSGVEWLNGLKCLNNFVHWIVFFLPLFFYIHKNTNDFHICILWSVELLFHSGIPKDKLRICNDCIEVRRM